MTSEAETHKNSEERQRQRRVVSGREGDSSACATREERICSLFQAHFLPLFVLLHPLRPRSPLGPPFWLHLSRCGEQATTLSCVGPFSHPAPGRPNPQPFSLKVVGLETSNGPYICTCPINQPYQPPLAYSLLPTPYLLFLYLPIYLFHLD